MKNPISRTLILIFIILFPILIYINVLSSVKTDSIRGPYRIVQGPANTIYVLMDRMVVHVQDDGGVLDLWSLEDLGIDGKVMDMAIGPYGNMLIGLQDSGEIRRYSPRGELLNVLPFKPKPSPYGDLAFWRILAGPYGSEVYLAEPFFKTISVYSLNGAPEKLITQAIIDEPAPEGPDPMLHWPSRMIMHQGQLYIADSNHQRVMVLDPDGHLHEMHETVIMGDAASGIMNMILSNNMGDTSTNQPIPYKGASNPVALSIADGYLFIITMNPVIEDRRVLRLDMRANRLHELFSVNTDNDPEAKVYPQDLLARDTDLLVADQEAINIKVFSHSGEYIETLGEGHENGFDRLARKVLRQKKIAQFSWKASLVSMLGLLVGLLIIARRNRSLGAKGKAAQAHQPPSETEEPSVWD